MLASPIELGQVTIHRVVEQQMPFFEAVKFFPTLTQEMLEENRSWLQPTYLDRFLKKRFLDARAFA